MNSSFSLRLPSPLPPELRARIPQHFEGWTIKPGPDNGTYLHYSRMKNLPMAACRVAVAEIRATARAFTKAEAALAFTPP